MTGARSPWVNDPGAPTAPPAPSGIPYAGGLVIGLVISIGVPILALYVADAVDLAGQMELVVGIGLWQLLWLVPAAVLAVRRAIPGMMPGLVIGGSMWFLFSTLCFGLLYSLGDI